MSIYLKYLKYIVFIGVAAGLMSALGLYITVSLLDDPWDRLGPDKQLSIRVEDRNGRLLREFPSTRETRSEWVALKDMSPHLLYAAVAAEDRRFYSHPGVDVLAVIRAAGQNILARRIVSGASTITMQLVRCLDPGPRTWKKKVREAILALVIERRHSKDEILEAYLNRIPCGNQLEGAGLAARIYLAKSPSNLSPAEAAFIMALPQAPSRLNPYRRRDLALARRSVIIDRMADSGFLNSDQADRALAEPLDLNPLDHHFHAPHFVTYIRSILPSPTPSMVRTTLDLDLQSQIERLVRETVSQSKKKGISQAAVVVLDHRNRQVLAWVGSADFFDPLEGQNDGVLAKRQPGSSVKPFTYATALEQGLSPASIIEDTPVEYGLDRGVYRPTNYDDGFRGDVSLRSALASSLNVPAVKLLEKVGQPLVYKKMKQAGLVSLDKDPDYYGLGLTLGSGEVSLLELANAYATLASGGQYREPDLFVGENPSHQVTTDETRVFTPQAAYLITDILSDDNARATGFGRNSLLDLPFPVAAKTGTSKNFRDNWTVGYTSEVVVAVWAGNFDARPMGRVSGLSGAGPLWHKVMRICAEHYPPRAFPRPKGIVEADVCPNTGLLTSPFCPNTKTELFIEGRTPTAYCVFHKPILEPEQIQTASARSMSKRSGLAITNPRLGERYLYDPGIESGFQNLELRAQAPAGLDTLVWSVNGLEVGRIPAGNGDPPTLYWPLKKGIQTIRVQGQGNGPAVLKDQITIVVY